MAMLDEQRRTIAHPGPRKKLVIRTGCLDCRAKGIRCDPNSKQCHLNTSTRWASNRHLARRQSGSKLTDRSPGIISFNTTWPGTLRERESLHFFCVITANELSGFLDTKFWRRLLPQATHHDRATRHAVAALGASHEHALRRQAFRLNAETDGLMAFGLRQCNKAINNLLRPNKTMSQNELIRALTISVLFASFESLCGNREGAIPHIVHSRRLVEHYKQSHPHSRIAIYFPITLDIIEPLIAHYECQIGSYVNEDQPDGMLNTFSLNAPLDFHNIADARVSLEQAIANFSLDVFALKDSHSKADFQAIAIRKSEDRAWLQRWETALSNFLDHSHPFMDQESLDGCRLLKAHQMAILTLVSVTYGEGENAWAEFTPQYRTVVDLVATIVNNLPKRGVATQVPQLPYLSSTMGMTEPLYCAATRCTDLGVAQRANELMSKLPWNEGVHSAWKIGFIERTLCEATGKVYVDPAESQVRKGSDGKVSMMEGRS